MPLLSAFIKRLICGASFVLFAATVAAAPDRPLNLVVAFAPGGIADLGARAIADGLSDTLKQTVVITNRGGAGGNIGAASVARTAPDGHTALITTTSIVVNPHVQADTGYRLQAFTPVVSIASSPNIVGTPRSGRAVPTTAAGAGENAQAQLRFAR